MQNFKPSYDPNPKQFRQVERHVWASVNRTLERLDIERQKDGVFAVAGGGPSIANHLPRLRELKAKGHKIACVNRAHNWLIEHDIIPDYCILFEVATDPRLLDQTPHEDITYLIASHCHEDAFEHFKDSKCLMWHALAGAGEFEILAEKEPRAKIIGGGSTSALRCINIGLVLGYRRFELFGMDSSFNGTSHVYHDEPPDYVSPMDIHFEGREYLTAHYLAKQAHEFYSFWKTHHFMFANMKVHGEGLLPDIHRHLAPQFYEVSDENQGS